jgi:hypothetical protein
MVRLPGPVWLKLAFPETTAPPWGKSSAAAGFENHETEADITKASLLTPE